MKYIYKDIELYKQLHKTRSYGDTGHNYCSDIISFIKETNAASYIDFGCGTGSLRKSLLGYGFRIDEFDPAIPGKDKIPKKNYDLVITTDVLEHLYENEIDNFFEEIMMLNPKFMYHAVSTRDAIIKLPDGTSCHKCIQNSNWWKEKLEKNTKAKKINVHDNHDLSIFKVVI